MTWNFRVIRKTRRVGRKIIHTYDLHEVFYNSKRKPTSWTKDPVDANGYESIKEMQETMCRMLADTFSPPLEIRGKKLSERKE